MGSGGSVVAVSGTRGSGVLSSAYDMLKQMSVVRGVVVVCLNQVRRQVSQCFRCRGS